MPATSKPPTLLQLRGTISGFNRSPKGHIEGAWVDTQTGPIQLNFPKHCAEVVAGTVDVGVTVDFNVEIEAEDGAHRIYRICIPVGEACGTVIRINYTLHGDVNGYHLDEGTFLYMRADRARLYPLLLGDRVRAQGVAREGRDAVVLEVRSLQKVEQLGKRHSAADRV